MLRLAGASTLLMALASTLPDCSLGAKCARGPLPRGGWAAVLDVAAARHPINGIPAVASPRRHLCGPALAGLRGGGARTKGCQKDFREMDEEKTALTSREIPRVRFEEEGAMQVDRSASATPRHTGRRVCFDEANLEANRRDVEV